MEPRKHGLACKGKVMTEISSRKEFGEEVSDIIRTTNVRGGDKAELELTANNFAIDVEVLGAFMQDGVGGDVEGSVVIAPERDRQWNRDMEVAQHIGDLKELANSRGHTAIFGFSGRSEDSGLLLGLPRCAGRIRVGTTS
ncbi:UNVERIFIED_CONTAM: hypothetical protein Sindi_1861200 [Sesamum indicum]